MNQKCKQLKSIARENLLGKYPIPIGMTFLYRLILSLICLPFIRMIYHGAAGKTTAIPLIIAGIGGLVILVLLAAIFHASILWLQIKIADRESLSGRDLLYPFRNHPDKFSGYAFLLTICAVICSLPGILTLSLAYRSYPVPALTAGILLLAAGAVVFILLLLSWGLTPFLLLEDPFSKTVLQAVRESSRLMKGRRRALFGMTVSFIGLTALGLLSFGIGLLWVHQYYYQALTVFYKRVLASNRKNAG